MLWAPGNQASSTALGYRRIGRELPGGDSGRPDLRRSHARVVGDELSDDFDERGGFSGEVGVGPRHLAFEYDVELPAAGDDDAGDLLWHAEADPAVVERNE